MSALITQRGQDLTLDDIHAPLKTYVEACDYFAPNEFPEQPSASLSVFNTVVNRLPPSQRLEALALMDNNDAEGMRGEQLRYYLEKAAQIIAEYPIEQRLPAYVAHAKLIKGFYHAAQNRRDNADSSMLSRMFMEEDAVICMKALSQMLFEAKKSLEEFSENVWRIYSPALVLLDLIPDEADRDGYYRNSFRDLAYANFKKMDDNILYRRAFIDGRIFGAEFQKHPIDYFTDSQKEAIVARVLDYWSTGTYAQTVPPESYVILYHSALYNPELRERTINAALNTMKAISNQGERVNKAIDVADSLRTHTDGHVISHARPIIEYALDQIDPQWVPVPDKLEQLLQTIPEGQMIDLRDNIEQRLETAKAAEIERRKKIMRRPMDLYRDYMHAGNVEAALEQVDKAARDDHHRETLLREILTKTMTDPDLSAVAEDAQKRLVGEGQPTEMTSTEFLTRYGNGATPAPRV